MLAPTLPTTNQQPNARERLAFVPMTLYIEDKFDIYVTVHSEAVFWFFENMLRLMIEGTKYTYGQTKDMDAL